MLRVALGRLLTVVLAMGAVVAFLRWFPPGQFTFYPACPFHALTGYLCPGCGATRALAELAAGRWTESLRLNALVAIGAPLLATRILWTGFKPDKIAIPLSNVPYLLGSAALFTILRNIDLH